MANASENLPSDALMTPSLAELLEGLKEYIPLAHFDVSLFSTSGELLAFRGTGKRFCGLMAEGVFCRDICRVDRAESFAKARKHSKPLVLRCQAGIIFAIVSFALKRDSRGFFVLGGVRERGISARNNKILVNGDRPDCNQALARWQELPPFSREEVSRTAVRIQALLEGTLGEDPNAIIFEKSTRRLNTLLSIANRLDNASSQGEVFSPVAEILTVLFDLPRMAVVRPEVEDRRLVLEGLLGIAAEPAYLCTKSAAELLRLQSDGNFLLKNDEVGELLPGLSAQRATCIPLASEERFFGLLVLLDVQLHPRDILLIESLTARVSSRLLRLELERENKLGSKKSFERLLGMIGTLTVVESKEELFGHILEMSAELVQASKGSLMFLDGGKENLHIAASAGMNDQLAKSLMLRIGEGIAGKVVSTGRPILVNDIEQDRRVGIPNRPRFATRSFMSIPLKKNDSVLGALNVADKENEEPFNQDDLEVLTTFASHFCNLLDRTATIQRVDELEQLSVTDELTGLFNRRYLERRVEEEISRSTRQKSGLTLMLIDLDQFKEFCQVNGPVAGEKALSRAARLLKEACRDMDVAFRCGGDKFYILLPTTSKQDSLVVAERVRRAIEGESFPGLDRLPFAMLTASLGVSSFPDDGASVAALLDAADRALDRARALGRNRIVTAIPSQCGEEIAYY